MPGGLLQIASSGIQDIYLTKNPEITFFKKIYRRHTNFSIETKEINIDQIVNYGDSFFINIPKNGDLIYRSYVKVELPSLKFDDSYINNEEYKNLKSNNLSNLNLEKNKWKKEYDSLLSFSEVQIIFYQKVKTLLKSQDVTYDNITDQTLILKNSYYSNLRSVVFLIDEDIKDKIDIISYVSKLNMSFGTEDNDENNTITIETFLSNIEILYNNIIKQLTYYFSNFIYYKKKYESLNMGLIEYAWINNIGHHYFTDFNVELDGQIIESYSNDYLNIFNSHNLKDNETDNYNELIGNVDSLNKLSSSKKTYDIYIPLIFWFNRSSTNALPIVSMKHSEVTINIKLNEITNLVYFYDYVKEYENLLILYLPYISHNIINNNNPESLWDSNYNVQRSDIDNVEYLNRERIYIYKFNKLTKELLKLKFSNLSDSDLDTFFNNYSSDTNKYFLSKLDWINFRNNSESNSDSSVIKICKNINLYKSPYFADENFLLSQIPRPNITFLTEYIYLDELERNKFASNNLEYIVNLPSQITTNIPNTEYFTTDIDLLKPSKDLIWFIKCNLSKNGLNKFSFKDPNILNSCLFFDEKIVSDMKFTVHDLQLIDFDKGENLYLYSNKYHKLNSTNNNILFYYSNFSLFPEEDQPSGTINFSVVKGKNIQIKINKSFLSNYFDTKYNINSQNLELVFINRNYSLLNFNKGKGTLVYY